MRGINQPSSGQNVDVVTIPRRHRLLHLENQPELADVPIAKLVESVNNGK
jgi:hypothetical protein